MAIPADGGDGEAPPLDPADCEPAAFSDRVLAFAADLAPFAAGFLGGGFALSRDFARAPWRLAWYALWAVLFAAYQSRFSADGRRSLGKRLLGLQVLAADGAPASARQGVLRSLGYAASSLFFGLGFLWALVPPDSRAWHDRLAGTKVVELGRKGAAARALSSLAALAVLAALAFGWAWAYAGRERWADMSRVADAERGLRALSALEVKYRAARGAYTADPEVLAAAFGDRRRFFADLDALVAPGSLRLEAGKERFRIDARALDRDATPVSVSGP